VIKEVTRGFIQQKENKRYWKFYSLYATTRDYGNGEISVGCKLLICRLI